MKSLLGQLNDELGGIVATARQSVVQLRNGRHGSGAGTILHADGLIVTNAHVVRRQAPKVTLADGRTFRGRLLAFDERTDLAAISVDGEALPILPLADGRGVEPGQWVVSLGHPWGVVGASTAGTVIDVGRPLEGLPYDGSLIQAGLHLRPGHSGGPMLNSQGELVGINTMLAGPYVGLAIPVQRVKRFLKDSLGSEGRRRRAAPRAGSRFI